MIDFTIEAKEILDLLDKVPLSKAELRRAIRPAAQAFFNLLQNELSKGWGVRTGRISREGLKLRVSKRDERGEGAAYSVYFSRAKGTRGKSDYIAPTYVARWLEGGTKEHNTSKGITRKRLKSGKIALNARQRKLGHPGFAARPIVDKVQKNDYSIVLRISRDNILRQLKKKGVEDA